MSTKEFWSGQFGDDYLRRNRVDWRARIPFWDKIIQMTGIRSVYEVGANCGWNLSAIQHSICGYNVGLHGCEINPYAETQAKYVGLNVERLDALTALDQYSGGIFELVFTAGVLIHIAPEDLQATMQSIIDASCDYVLAVEYAAEQEEEVLYRGHEGKLWKRPYGKLYQDMGLTLVDAGFLSKGSGFDDCNWWLLRK